MRLRHFLRNVESDDRLRGIDLWQGHTPAEDTVVVEGTESGQDTVFAVPVILEVLRY